MIKTIALLTFGLLVGGSPVMMADGEPVEPPTTEIAPDTSVETSEPVISEETTETPTTSEEVVPPVIDDENTVEQMWDEVGKWFQENLPPVVISNIVQGVVLLGGIFKVLAYAKELAKKNHSTMDDVILTVKTVLKDGITDEVQKGLNDMINPLRDSVNEMKPYFETFAKILTLSQDNSPEARLAILQLIQDMGKTDTKILVEETKKAVEESEAKKNEDQTEKVDTLDEIIGEKEEEPVIIPVE